jgi:ATP-binding cassette, subfamily B, bacterial PglK
MIERFRQYADLADFDERLRWVLVLVLALAVSVLEAVGALLVYLLLGLVTGAEDVLQIPVFGDIREVFPDVERGTLLLGAAGIIAGFFLLRAVVLLGQEYVESRITENAGARLSRRLARGYLTMPYAFHLQRNSAELIRNSYQTVQSAVSGVFKPLINIVSEGFIVLGILAVLLLTAPLATAVVVAVLGSSALVLLRIVFPRLKALGRERQLVLR